jgi:hypothetical protein
VTGQRAAPEMPVIFLAATAGKAATSRSARQIFHIRQPIAESREPRGGSVGHRIIQTSPGSLRHPPERSKRAPCRSSPHARGIRGIADRKIMRADSLRPAL